MDGPDAFLEEGKRLFWEKQAGLREKLTNGIPLSEAEKRYCLDAAREWMRGQVLFARERVAALAREFEGLDESTRRALREHVFVHASETTVKMIENAVSPVESWKDVGQFDSMLTFMGYAT